MGFAAPQETPAKRLRTPSTVREIDALITALQLYKERVKLASSSPEVFLPTIVFEKHPALPKKYKLVSDFKFVDVGNVENTIYQLQQSIIHSLIISHEGHFVFVTQFEGYVKDKEIDDVAIINKLEKPVNTLRTKLETCQEGRNAWKELKLLCGQFEVVITGGLYGSYTECSGYLGVSVPTMLCDDTSLLLFSPVIPAQSIACVRMLRNYMKKQSLKCWLRKSKYFADIGFTTPSPLSLDNHKNPYVAICSKVVRHAANRSLNKTVSKELQEKLKETRYWEQMGLTKALSAKKTLKKLQDIKTGGTQELSQAKRLLIEVVLNSNNAISTSSLLIVYNGILYPEVKKISKQAINQTLHYMSYKPQCQLCLHQLKHPSI